MDEFVSRRHGRRSRFVEDLVAEREADGVVQYVLLGAGLDAFAQRRADLASRLRVFEIDQPGPQAWKRERLEALGYPPPDGCASCPSTSSRVTRGGTG